MKLNLFIFEVNIFEIAQSTPVLIIITFPCVQPWGSGYTWEVGGVVSAYNID